MGATVDGDFVTAEVGAKVGVALSAEGVSSRTNSSSGNVTSGAGVNVETGVEVPSG